MKIIGINGSPRGDQSRTRRLVQAVLDGATEAGAETELIDVSTYDLKYCTGCGVCYAQGECRLPMTLRRSTRKFSMRTGSCSVLRSIL